ncbi:putative fructose transport system kinase [Shigella boydii]|nr:putative fructose transport system kinase [Shigella boydii]
MKIELTVNGLKIQAQYQNEEIENVHKPLLRMLAALQTVNPQRRTVVFLCAPPGTGKLPKKNQNHRTPLRNLPSVRPASNTQQRFYVHFQSLRSGTVPVSSAHSPLIQFSRR